MKAIQYSLDLESTGVLSGKYIYILPVVYDLSFLLLF